jgi:hypothetical protein
VGEHDIKSVIGAGYGMCDSSPHLGFAVKGRVTADYIKTLTFDKRVLYLVDERRNEEDFKSSFLRARQQ